MSDAAVVPAPAAGAEGAGQPAARPAGSFWGTVLRMALMWAVMSYMKGNGANKAAVTKDPHKFSTPLFQKGQLVDMHVFMTEEVAVPGGFFSPDSLVWKEENIRLAVADPRNTTFTFKPSPTLQNNGSLYLHVVFSKAGSPISPEDPAYDESVVYGRPFNLITYLPKPKNNTGVNLLSGDKPADIPKDDGPREYVSFLKPNITIQTVDHFQTYPKGGVPPQVGNHMQFDVEGNHYPIIFFNDFWLLRDYLIPMNSTVDEVTVYVDCGHVSLTWWQLLQAMDKSFDSQRSMGLQGDGESDELKRVFLEGNPYLLALTMVVSMLHTVFDMLAFKNDIGFWKNNKSMEGLSARSVLINAGCQAVILLYLLDNETSMVVLFSSFMGTAIEFWKVTKAMKVTLKDTFPFIKFEDRASYTQTKTKQYDEEATRYLSYVLYPLVCGYAVYSLMYKTHKSWYSWIVNSLVGAVYMFGFILMCPQLYLNYKLKSVAHLPWRQMTYKFLNTIIDDLFAFVIKMPLLHRLSVFRDDLIFLIYLYQRWVYRVDYKRVNEFGWSGEADGAVPGAEVPAVEGAATPALDGTTGEAGTSSADQKKTRRKDATVTGPAVADTDGAAASAAANGDDKKDS